MKPDIRPRPTIPASRTTKGTGVKKHARGLIVGLLKYGVGFGLLAYILHQNWDPKFSQDVPPKMLTPGISGLLKEQPDILAFAALAVMGAVCFFLQFVRWYALVRALDLPFTIGNAFRLGLIGCFYNAFLPGSVGGDLVKAYFIARDTPGMRAAAVATVIADRMIGLFGLIWFAAVFGGAFWLAGDPRIVGNAYLEKIILVCSVLVAITVVVWIGLGILPVHRQERFAKRLESVPKLGKTLAEIWFVLCTYRQRSKVIYALIALTAVVHLDMVLMLHVAVRVFATVEPGTLSEHFVVAPMGYIAQAFFPAPGGVGGAEYIFGYLYSQLNRPDATGIIGRLTLRVIEWSIGLVGLFFFLRMRDVLPVVEKEAAEEGYGGHP